MLKTFEVSTSYTTEIKAKDAEEAKQLFIEELDRADANWTEDCVEVKEIK